nr:MAG TPA: hypothetical protein [Microviridae sp.]
MTIFNGTPRVSSLFDIQTRHEDKVPPLLR